MAEPIPLDPLAAMDGAIIPEGWVARQFANTYKGKLLYCHTHKSWFQFDGAIWRRQEAPVAYRLIHDLSTKMSAEANAKNLIKMQSASYAGGVEQLARASEIFSKVGTDWDKDLWTMGTPNGAIDLRSGNSIRPKAADMITKSVSVTPSEIEDCPMWDAFLEEATGEDRDLIRFLQQLCGYALTGDISEQSLFFVFGNGGNGKGVFLSTVQAILGDYSVVSSMETFEPQKFTSNTADLAMMRGARLVSASEGDEDSTWNTKRVKLLTGGDQITARYLYANPITFTPQFTLLIISNHKPNLATVDDAMRRRVNMIPFTRKPKKKDPQLVEKLREEWPGILRWMINGCLDWQRNGLVRPAVVLEATDKYFEDQNTMQEWVDSYCDVDRTNPHWTASTLELFNSWSKYCKAIGELPGASKSFKQSMERLGFVYKRTATFRGFVGVKLPNPASHSADGFPD